MQIVPRTLVLSLAALLPIHAQSQLYLFQGDAAEERMGCCVGSAGDVDADGIGDLIVAAVKRKYAGNSPFAPRTQLRSGRNGVLLRVFDGVGDGSAPSVYLENTYRDLARAAGDLDLDGHADVIVGFYGHEARVHSGADGAVLFTLPGGGSGTTSFGSSVLGGADLEGDGIPDLVVGAYKETQSGCSQHGAVYAYSGANAAQLYEFALPGLCLGWMGYDLQPAGDVNADGFPDVLATTDEHGYTACVISGPSGALLLSSQVPGGLPGVYPCAGGGDLDADGYPELAFGSGWSSDIAVYSTASATTQLLPAAGHVPAFVGDLDGDGHTELAVGAPVYGDAPGMPGLVQIYSGATGQLLHVLSGTASGDRFGYELHAAGDLDGDGRGELVIGAIGTDAHGSESGSVYVYSFGSASCAGGSHEAVPGCPGIKGFTPVLTSSGCAMTGASIGITLTNGVGGAPAWLVVGDTLASIPLGGSCLFAPTPVLAVLPIGALHGLGPSFGWYALQLGPSPPLPSGASASAQAFAFDLASPIGISASNGLQLVFP